MMTKRFRYRDDMMKEGNAASRIFSFAAASHFDLCPSRGISSKIFSWK
jgi:hypothetical protein